MTAPDLTALADKLDELAMKAPSGEWFDDNLRVDGSNGRNDYYTALFDKSGNIIADTLNSTNVLLEEGDEGRSYDVAGQATIALVVALRNALPQITTALREAARLREALEKIANHATGGVGGNPAGFVQFARAALESPRV